MRKKALNKFNINGILIFFNFIVACLLISAFFSEGINNNPYVDNLTLIIGLLLSLQIYLALKLEKKNSDPFILIMGYLIIFFYELRIFTLVHFPVQDVFLRFDYFPSDTNYALFYILLANIFIFLGFQRVKLERNSSNWHISNYSPSKANIKLGFTLFIFSIIFDLLIQKNLPESFAHFINIIYNNFLTPNLILIVLAVYIISFRHNLSINYTIVLFIGAMILFVLQTLSYSRSGLLTFVDNILIVILAMLPKLQFRRIFVYIGFLFLPVFFSLAMLFYSISTLSRQYKGDDRRTIIEKMNMVLESRAEIENSQIIELYLGQAFSRAGYFDYSAELIANKDKYEGIFTFGNYFKSIIDNILTPGFDLFDQPMLSNSLKYSEGNIGSFSKKQEATDTYHTDQFGLYGEMYNVFGYFSLIVLYYFSYYIKKLFRHRGNLNPLLLGLKNFTLLYLFYRFFNSFGIDWILMNLITLSVSFLILSRIFHFRINFVNNKPRLKTIDHDINNL